MSENKSIKPKLKRKTYTSSEVKARYNNKTYRRYTLSLRWDTDGGLIEEIEKEIKKGEGVTEIIKKLIIKKQS